MNVLANIARVDMITEETTPVAYTFNTGSEATLEPYTSEGSQNMLRVKNSILAQNNFEDITMGYDVSFKDVVFDERVFTLIDGGILTTNAGEFTYEGPQMGTVLSRKRFTLDIWTEEKDTDGDTLGYQRFRLKHSYGTPVKFSHKDSSFYAPEYSIKSRPKSGEKPIQIKSFAALPDAGKTASQLLSM